MGRRELGHVMMWVGLSNLMLVGLFVFGQGHLMTQAAALFSSQDRQSVIGRTPDPVAALRMFRRDSELITKERRTVHKDDLAMTFAFYRSGSVLPYSAEGSVSPVAQGSEADVPAQEPTQGQKLAPVLRGLGANGQVEIGNFKSLSLAGTLADCLDFGYSMLSDAGSSKNRLEILTKSPQITISRICATNGSVVISCRGEQITVSPRRPRPDDECGSKTVAASGVPR